MKTTQNKRITARINCKTSLYLQVKDVFLPSNNDLHHKFIHGYVVHQNQKDLYKLDLEAMKYVKTIDLGNYDCVPHSVSYVPLGSYKSNLLKGILVYC